MKRSVVSAKPLAGANPSARANNPAVSEILRAILDIAISCPCRSLGETLRDPFPRSQSRSLTQAACRADVAGLRRFADSRIWAFGRAGGERKMTSASDDRLCHGGRPRRALSPEGAVAGRGRPGAVRPARRPPARLNAFCVVDRDGALAAARASEVRWQRGEPLGPLDGVPVTIKDLVLMRGFPTLRGSRLIDPAQDWPKTARRSRGCARPGR